MADPVTPLLLETEPRYSALLVDPNGEPAPLGPEPDAELPAPERIARRALVVLTLAWRSALERHRPAGAEPQIVVASGWADARGLVEEMEPEERALLRAPPWTWTERVILDRGWATEGAAVLAWALGGPPIPRHDRQVDGAALAKALGLFAAAPAALVSPALRPVEELAWMRNRVLGVRWRLRELALHPGPMDFAAFARERWAGRLDLDGLPLVDGDLALGGVPLARAEEPAIHDAQSIAVERHRAIEWVCGAHPLWSKVDVNAWR